MAQKPLFKNKKKTVKAPPPKKLAKIKKTTKKGAVMIRPKKAAAKAEYFDNSELTKFVNRKNELTASAYATAHGGKVSSLTKKMMFSLLYWYRNVYSVHC